MGVGLFTWKLRTHLFKLALTIILYFIILSVFYLPILGFLLFRLLLVILVLLQFCSLVLFYFFNSLSTRCLF